MRKMPSMISSEVDLVEVVEKTWVVLVFFVKHKMHTGSRESMVRFHRFIRAVVPDLQELQTPSLLLSPLHHPVQALNVLACVVIVVYKVPGHENLAHLHVITAFERMDTSRVHVFEV